MDPNRCGLTVQTHDLRMTPSMLPDRKQQIRQSHATLICEVVGACGQPDAVAQLEPLLSMASANGWESLVSTLRKIVAGDRGDNLLHGLDEEDSVIVQAVLEGLQNPDSLPDTNYRADASLAAPGLAGMIHAASRGDTDALQAAAHMAEQMTQVGGDMGHLGSIMRRLINGERNPAALCKGMSRNAEQLIVNLLAELSQLSEH